MFEAQLKKHTGTRGIFSKKTLQIFGTDFRLQNEDIVFGKLKYQNVQFFLEFLKKSMEQFELNQICSKRSFFGKQNPKVNPGKTIVEQKE